MATTTTTHQDTFDASLWTVREDKTVSEQECERLSNGAFRQFEKYISFSTDRSQLFFVKVHENDRLIGITPAVRVVKHDCRTLITSKSKWWLVPLIGPFANKTTYILETSVMGFQYASPFFTVAGVDRLAFKKLVTGYLQDKDDHPDHIWISEPPEEAKWAKGAHHVDQFNILSTTHVEIGDFKSPDEYDQSLSRNRRQSNRKAAKALEKAGGRVEILDSPSDDDVLQAMGECLNNSEKKSWIGVPFNDVLNSTDALKTLDQIIFVARVDGKIVGFLSYIANGEEFLQTHGGLDYDISHQTKAYQNLLHASVHFAIDRGLNRVSFGPLNNETKRRMGSHQRPVVASLWSRNPLFRFVTRRFVIPNFLTFNGYPD